jgi:hypothetical protein
MVNWVKRGKKEVKACKSHQRRQRCLKVILNNERGHDSECSEDRESIE